MLFTLSFLFPSVLWDRSIVTSYCYFTEEGNALQRCWFTQGHIASQFVLIARWNNGEWWKDAVNWRSFLPSEDTSDLRSVHHPTLPLPCPVYPTVYCSSAFPYRLVWPLVCPEGSFLLGELSIHGRASIGPLCEAALAAWAPGGWWVLACLKFRLWLCSLDENSLCKLWEGTLQNEYVCLH